MNICISGLTAAGKTTHCHLVAGEFGLGYISASQILLSLAGLAPVQSRDFWLSPSAEVLWTDEMTVKIDTELRRLSNKVTHYVFDSFALPWRVEGPSFNIYLHSDLNSRIKKALISHRGEGRLLLRSYAEQIERKDDALTASHRRLFGLADDELSCFHLVLDISAAITESTYAASLKSISLVQECIRPAVAFALRPTAENEQAYIRVKRKHQQLFRRDTVLGSTIQKSKIYSGI